MAQKDLCKCKDRTSTRISIISNCHISSQSKPGLILFFRLQRDGSTWQITAEFCSNYPDTPMFDRFLFQKDLIILLKGLAEIKINNISIRAPPNTLIMASSWCRSCISYFLPLRKPCGLEFIRLSLSMNWVIRDLTCLPNTFVVWEVREIGR